MTSGQTLLTTVRLRLGQAADLKKAKAMQAYMKSSMPYHGVVMPEVRRLCRELFSDVEFATFSELAEAVRVLWFGAKYREERYAALRLLDRQEHRPAKAAFALYEELIHTGAWWDLVDDVATHWLHPFLGSDPTFTRQTLRRWSRSDDLWLRRAAIIAQVQAHEATDVPLLFELIEPAIDEKEFFLRKAIGWALRSLAKDQPEAVLSWLDEHGERASGLTKREAEKGLAAGQKKRRRTA